MSKTRGPDRSSKLVRLRPKFDSFVEVRNIHNEEDSTVNGQLKSFRDAERRVEV